MNNKHIIEFTTRDNRRQVNKLESSIHRSSEWITHFLISVYGEGVEWWRVKSKSTTE